MSASGFERNVFVNCPFDSEYLPLLRPLLFCVIDLGFQPRIALEALDSGEPRIEKLVALIEQSKFGVHDLSRLKAAAAGEISRLNMPFELGLDVGCRRYKGGQWTSKRILILETERYRYQAALSDLSGCDISVHADEPIEIVRCVRNWLNGQAKLRAVGAERIWGRFNDFMAANFDALESRGFSQVDIARISVDELIDEMQAWRARTPL